MVLGGGSPFFCFTKERAGSQFFRLEEGGGRLFKNSKIAEKKICDKIGGGVMFF